MTPSETTTARDVRGYFQPGQSGNPAGKKPGTLNHSTRLKQALDAGDFETAVTVQEHLRKGSFAAARLRPPARSRLTARRRGVGKTAAGSMSCGEMQAEFRSAPSLSPPGRGLG